jgi:hypothetical protein
MPQPPVFTPDASPAPPVLTDQRAAVRYLNDRDAFSYSLGKGSDVCLVAHVHDLSRNGIGLVLAEDVAVGTVLNVELQSKSQKLPCFLLARVVWSKARADGSRLVGCQFARPLSVAELRALL